MRVLLADDDAIARLLLSRQLSSMGYEVLTAQDGDGAWEALKQADAPEIALLDWKIRGLPAASVCRRVRMNEVDNAKHIIALVGTKNKDDREAALESGCDDFVTKPADRVEVQTRMRLAARLVEMRLRVAEEDTRDDTEASHDRLTGLWNRAAILQFLTGQFARSSRDGVSIAVAVANVDKLSEYNERHGRAAGDALLRQIASRMRSVVRPYDWLGRTEGDSFLIIAPDCTLSNGFAMCERLRSVVAEAAGQTDGGGRGITMSFGLATSAESGVMNEDALLRAAEAALYEAKQNGRNRVEMAKRRPRLRSTQSGAMQTSPRELVQ